MTEPAWHGRQVVQPGSAAAMSWPQVGHITLLRLAFQHKDDFREARHLPMGTIGLIRSNDDPVHQL